MIGEPEVPQFAVPFTLTPTGAAVVEQGSPEDIQGCVLNVLACPVGACVERPGFGVTRLQFAGAPLDLRRLVEQVAQWVPEASLEAVEEALSEQELAIVVQVSP